MIEAAMRSRIPDDVPGAGRRRRGGYDLMVLGGGTGGLIAAQVAAGAGARVALVERERTGGDCLWTGCVPSKSLIASADLAARVRQAAALGLDAQLGPVDLGRVLDRARDVIDAIEPADSPARLRAAGVDVLEGNGTFTGPRELCVDGTLHRFRAAIVATGAAPALPPLPGLAGADVVTSATLWGLRELPRRLVVLGGGAIGCELGQAFSRLGSEVQIVDAADRLLTREEPEASAVLAACLRADGVRVRLGAGAVAVRRDAGGGGALELAGGERLPFDVLLVAAGRAPRGAGLGLEALGVAVDERGAIPVGEDLRTAQRHLLAVGDVTGRPPFTHVAAHHGRIAALNALFGLRRAVDPVLPRATFTRPEVAQVGLTVAEAREQHGDDVVLARSELATLDRALTERRPEGFCLLVGDARGRLLGATMVGAAAGEVIAELTARVKHGDPIEALSTTVHAYPTMAEGPSRAADDHLRVRFARPVPRALGRAALAAIRAAHRTLG